MEVKLEVHPAYIFSAVEFVTGLSFTNEMFLFTFTLHECGAHGLIKSNFILQFKSTGVPYLVRRVVNTPAPWVRLGKHCLLEGA